MPAARAALRGFDTSGSCRSALARRTYRGRRPMVPPRRMTGWRGWAVTGSVPAADRLADPAGADERAKAVRRRDDAAPIVEDRRRQGPESPDRGEGETGRVRRRDGEEVLADQGHAI